MISSYLIKLLLGYFIQFVISSAFRRGISRERLFSQIVCVWSATTPHYNGRVFYSAPNRGSLARRLGTCVMDRITFAAVCFLSLDNPFISGHGWHSAFALGSQCSWRAHWSRRPDLGTLEGAWSLITFSAMPVIGCISVSGHDVMEA